MRRLSTYLAVIALGLCLGTVGAAIWKPPTAGVRYGGDLVAFVAAGEVVREGRGELLYQLSEQARMQRHVGADIAPGEVLRFPYPAPVAMFFVPLAYMSLRAAYVVCFLGSVAAVFGAMVVFAPLVPRCPLPLVLPLSLMVGPLWSALELGQTTPWSLLGFALYARLTTELAGESQSGPRRIAAGVVAAMLLLKPGVGWPMVPLLVLRRDLLTGAATVVTLALLSALAAVVVDAAWISAFLRSVASFAEADVARDIAHDITIHRRLGAAGAPLLLVAAALVVGPWLRRVSPRHQIALASCGVVLLSPHAGYYEAGLLLLPGLVLWDAGGAVARGFVLAAWAAALVATFSVLPSMLFLWALALLVVTSWVAFRSTHREATPRTALPA